MTSRRDSLGRGLEHSDQGAECTEEIMARMRDGRGSVDPWFSALVLCLLWGVVTSKSGEASRASPGRKSQYKWVESSWKWNWMPMLRVQAIRR